MAFRFLIFALILGAAGYLAGSRLTEPALNLAFQYRHLGSASLNNGPWKTYENLATPKLRPFIRAMVANIGLGALTSEEAIYWLATTDRDDKPLDGSLNYEIRFPPQQLHREGGFWSLSLYGQDHFFVKNDANTYSLGARDNLVRNSDGSLSIIVSSRGPDTDNNWLPSPDGSPFSLTLRYYIPDQQMIDDPAGVSLPTIRRLGPKGAGS